MKSSLSKYLLSTTLILIQILSICLFIVIVCRRYRIQKVETKSTCSEEKKEDGTEQPPPEKKQRLSNREYKKLTKGQNKVRDSTILCLIIPIESYLVPNINIFHYLFAGKKIAVYTEET